MLDTRFGRSRRLVTKLGFKTVFDDATYKISHRNLLILARKNGLNRPRLGMVIAKKNIKFAVDRNRVKRVVRETFRLNQQVVEELDIVFLARRGLDKLDSSAQNKVLIDSWRKLSRQVAQSK